MKYFDIKRPPVAGTFTVGMKVLTGTALKGRGEVKATPGAQKIYDDGIRSGASWKEIEIALRAAGPWNKFPLVPNNTLYFTLFQERCVMPGIADAMLDRYGETREDGVKRIYSFPVVFFSDTIDEICASGFKSWKNTRLDKFSAVNPTDGHRHCITYEKLQKREKAKRGRAPRVWGGRQKTDLGLCEPNECETFINGECMHEATLFFRVPGVPTGSMYLSLTTKSIYSLLDFVGDPEDPNSTGILGQALKDFGRVSGLFHGKPLFWLSKSVDTIHRTDWLKGTQVREEKEIIHLTTPGVDTVDLLEELGEKGEMKDLAAGGPDQITGFIKIRKESHKPRHDLDDPGDGGGEGAEITHGHITDNGAAMLEHYERPPVVDDTPTALVADLRKDLIEVLKLFPAPWSFDDLKEWMDANGYVKEDSHDVDKLKEIIGKLEVSAAKSKPVAEPEKEEKTEEKEEAF